MSSDAVVIGAGPNGLVAANLLADAGWDVTLLEANPQPGGAVASSDDLGPGWVLDVCSAFYPLAVASPAITGLRLEEHGLRWRHAPAVLGHPLPDGTAAVIHRDLERTMAGLEALCPSSGDGAAWAELARLWTEIREDLLGCLFTPFPPVRAGLRLATRLRPAGLVRLARLLAVPVRRLAQERFTGAGPAALLAGSALHADLAPEAAGSAVFGWLMAMLAQDYGFPVPEGGAGQLSAAMAARFRSRGGQLLCDHRAEEVVVRDGRAVGVRTADGEVFPAGRAVLADVAATNLYGGLVSWDHLPATLVDDLRAFQWDWATFKVDWALDGPIPWEAPEVGGCGTVHLASGVDEITQYAAELAQQLVPAHPFMILGQMTTSDPSRSPAGTEQAWAYTHIPREVRGDAGRAGIGTGRAGSGGVGAGGAWSESAKETFADRLEAHVERYAPGFRSRISRRHIMGPAELEAHDANLVGGAINGGTASVHQQLVFRPTPGTGRPETPVAGLYLASASAHPGGGVHGACGSNAARAALNRAHPVRRLAGPALAATGRALKKPPPFPV